MATNAATPGAAVDRSGQALEWAKANLAKGVDPERLVAGLMQQGWPEYDARQVLDAALTDSAPPPVPPYTAPKSAARPVMSYRTPAQAARQPSGESARHVRQMGYGALLLIVGVAITVGTMSVASHGGNYVLCWGPIIFGFIRLITGFVGWIGSR